jgi:hypothetical protein
VTLQSHAISSDCQVSHNSICMVVMLDSVSVPCHAAGSMQPSLQISDAILGTSENNKEAENDSRSDRPSI